MNKDKVKPEAASVVEVVGTCVVLDTGQLHSWIALQLSVLQ